MCGAVVAVANWGRQPVFELIRIEGDGGSDAKSARRERLSDQDLRAGVSALLIPPNTKSLLAQAPLSFGGFVWDDEGVNEGSRLVWIDLRRQILSVYRDGHEIGTSILVYGAPDMGTPRGTFPILRKVVDYRSRTYDAPMPYSLFLTSDGVAVHASRVKEGRATHGCIGVPETFARRLFNEMRVGDRVVIVESSRTIEA